MPESFYLVLKVITLRVLAHDLHWTEVGSESHHVRYRFTIENACLATESIAFCSIYQSAGSEGYIVRKKWAD